MTHRRIIGVGTAAMLPGAGVLAIMRYPTNPDRFASETLQGQSRALGRSPLRS
jgi:hypothetical protein